MANETSGRRDNRVPFRASTKTPNIMMLRRTRLLLIVCGILAFAVLGIKLFSVMIIHHDEYEKNGNRPAGTRDGDHGLARRDL